MLDRHLPQGADTGNTKDGTNLKHGKQSLLRQSTESRAAGYLPCPLLFFRPGLALLLTELPCLVFLNGARDWCSTFPVPLLLLVAMNQRTGTSYSVVLPA